VKSGTNIKLILHCNNQERCNRGTGIHPTMHNTYRYSTKPKSLKGSDRLGRAAYMGRSRRRICPRALLRGTWRCEGLPTTWWWVISFPPRPVYPWGKSPRCPLNRTLSV